MIVRANKDDILYINELGKLVYENFTKTYLLNDYLQNDNYIIMVSKNEKIDGFVIFYKNIDYYELELIVVSQNMRNKGIASEFIQTFINNYCKIGDEIILEVSTKNELAHKLYKKFGFQIINIRKKYYKDSDAYIMKKVI